MTDNRQPFRIGWFSTGRDEAARDLLRVVVDAIHRGELKAQIEFVFSNREPGEAWESDLFFDLVREYAIPLVTLSSKKSGAGKSAKLANGVPAWRADYDREAMRRLAGFHPDLCVLAGYMLIVGEEMCHRYPMINLHPAAPGGPAGTWQEVIWKLIENRAESTGVMMHLVIPELDKGPAATFCTFTIKGEAFDELWESDNEKLFLMIREHGVARELPLMVATLKAFAEGRVTIKDGQIVDANGRPIQGYDLTEEIDALLPKEAR